MDDTRMGRITIEGEVATITFVRRLNHPVDAVWAALTDPDQRAVWFGRTTLDPRVGGLLETLADGPPAPPEVRRLTGRIRAWDPPHVFEHESIQTLVGETIVRYELTADGDATILRLTHTRLSVPNAGGYIPGQHVYLDRLEAHLDKSPLPRWMDRYQEVQDSYAK